MRSAASELGTLRRSVSPSKPRGRTPGNQAAQVAGASCSRSVAEPWSQISSAVNTHRSFATTAGGLRRPPSSCPQERPQVWRSPRCVARVRPGSCCDTPEEPDSRPAAERGAQRSTGVLVRQGAAGVFPRARDPIGRSALRGAGPDPYTGSFPPPARSPTSGRARPPRGGSSVEAHVPAQQSQARQDPRLPPPDAHQGGPRRAARPPGPRPEAPLRLIWRVRDRATFEALAGARRQRAGPVSLRFLTDGSDDPPRVAYAIGRRFGTAVERNRARRRLRAAVALDAGTPAPGGAYLVRRGTIRHDPPLSHAA